MNVELMFATIGRSQLTLITNRVMRRSLHVQFSVELVNVELMFVTIGRSQLALTTHRVMRMSLHIQFRIEA